VKAAKPASVHSGLCILTSRCMWGLFFQLSWVSQHRRGFTKPGVAQADYAHFLCQVLATQFRLNLTVLFLSS